MGKAEKEAVKSATKAEKEATAAPDSASTPNELQGEVKKTESGIEVGDPMDLRPKKLPLVVKLPANASSAQKEYAKILNGYAYQNPEKWAKKKGVLLKRLELLADQEVSLDEDRSLSINKSKVSFVFLRDGKGNEIAANSSLPKLE
jgi:hypothetical protein